MRRIFILIFLLGIFGSQVRAQCGPNVPSITVDLSVSPNATWVSPPVARLDTCCGATGSKVCIEFIVTLHPNAQGLIFDVSPGSSGFYQVGCGPPIAAKSPVCLSGAGPHFVTYCKPGGNADTYSITSVVAPGVGPSLSVNDGCMGQIFSEGYDPLSINWTSITGGLGLYDSYMDCSTCDSVNITAAIGYPPFVDYQICGTPLGGCDTILTCDTVRVTFNSTLLATIAPVNPTVCFGAVGTTITGVGGGGTPPYNYLWSTGDTTSSIFINVGTYTVTISDSTNCPPAIDTIIVTSFANVISTDAGTDQTVCMDISSINLAGSVVAAFGGVWTGGTGAFSPNDSDLNASYSPSLAEIAAGNVTLYLTTTGNGSCPSATDTLNIILIGFTASVNVNPTAVSCFGGNDGSAIISVTGTNAPYTYSWNTIPIQTGDTATNLSAGTYSVNVTNALGCDSLYSITIIEPTVLSSSITGIAMVNCKGNNDGYATANGIGGTAPYTYLWDANAANQTTATANNLVAGTYTVQVIDNNGCIVLDTLTITEPSSILNLSLIHTDISCYGLTDGSLNSTPSGGTAPYTYVWSPGGQVSQGISNLSSGTYGVTVTDSSGLCVALTGLNIIEPLPLSSSDTINAVSCFNGFDGSATVSGIGGITPYTYQWGVAAGNIVGANINTLSTGLYLVTITDSNGCVFDTNVFVNQPLALVLASNFYPVSCFGGSNGTAGVIAVGGTTPYSYLWDVNASSQTTDTATSLSVGLYNVVITDSNGCNANTSVTVTQPTQLMVDSMLSNPVLCFGDSTGSAQVQVSGGTSPYTYLWDANANNQISDSAVALYMGSFNVLITDSNGCIIDSTVAILQPTVLSASMTSLTVVSCYGGGNGAATVGAIGGTTPYSFVWPVLAGSQTTATATNLIAGNYIVTIVDANGCQDTTSVSMTEPLFALSDTLNMVPVTCFGGSDGLAISTPFGGTSPYTYLWSTNTGSQVSDSATGLALGTYNVTITDAKGCTFLSSISITQPDVLTFGVLSTSSVKCFGGADGTATAMGSGGIFPYTYKWGANTGNQLGPIAGSLGTGTYAVTITDANGCTGDTSIVVDQPAMAVQVTGTTVPVNCFAGSDASATVNIIGGTTPYAILWSTNTGSQTGVTATNLGAGWYQAWVSDSNGCLDTAFIQVTQPSVPLSLSISSNPVTCNGFSDGVATVTGSGGTTPFTYLWDANAASQSSSNAVNLAANTYGVTVTDANGCEAITQVTVTQPDPITIFVSPDDTVCTVKNFDLWVNAFGGNGGYSYTWNNGLPNANLVTTSTLNSNNYTVSVTDALGCPGVMMDIDIWVFLMDADSLMVTSTGDVCIGESTDLNAFYYGANGPYTYLWNQALGTNPGPISVSPIATTIYEVTVTDKCNNSVSNFVVVNLLQSPVVRAPQIIAEGCGPLSVQFHDHINDSGLFNYVWNFGDGNTSNDDTPVHIYTQPGTYNISIQKISELGCKGLSKGKSKVIVYPFPIAKGIANKYVTDETKGTILFTDQSVGAQNVLWKFSTLDSSIIRNPTYTYTDTGLYQVYLTVDNVYGCVGIDTLQIKITPDVQMNIPNAFIPNSKGGNGGTYDLNSLSNEVFFPRTEYVDDFHMLIFNRWGEIVFESFDVNIGWDGYYRGQLAAQDVYVWKIDIIYTDGTQLSEVGNVTLLN